MSYQLPPNMLRLFQPRPQLPQNKGLNSDIDPRKKPAKTRRPMDGIAAFLEQARQDAADKGEATNDVVMAEEEEGAAEEGEATQAKTATANGEGSSSSSSNGVRSRFTYTEQMKREMRREQRKKRIEDAKARGLADFDPSKDPEAQGDPFCTLFVSRLDYGVTEKDLQRTFDVYGPIQRIRLVRDKNGKSRGYAFVVYERERDMRAAYKDTEGIKIQGRRAMVDVERGRTVKDWKPTRLGGGLGGLTRKKKETPPPEPVFAPASRGGFRGGFRGGGGFGGGRGGGGGFGARGGGRFGGGGGGGFGGPPPPMPGPGGYPMPAGGQGGYGGGAGGYGPPRGGGGGDGYGRFDGPPAKRGRY